MKTLIERAKEGKITREMHHVSECETMDAEKLRTSIASGLIVIPKNSRREIKKVIGIGRGMRVKVNANIGSSPDAASLKEEIKKMNVAVDAGADTLMDLSIGGDIRSIRKMILKKCPVPLGTVPIYQAAVQCVSGGGKIVEMNPDHIFSVIEEQAREGVDFMTVHCGVTKESLEKLKEQGRLMGIVSRGGSFLASWITHNKKENPLYEQYDRLLEIAKKYDVTLSLGDGLRPGCIADANDKAQLKETEILGDLTKRAWETGVQIMVEGPGHVPLHKIKENMEFQKRVCHGAPYYVLGPLVTDIAPGYDHITSAIGGAIAAWNGADFLCYVTPSEHLGLPTAADVREGVIASRIAAHAADIAKGVAGAEKWDHELSGHRLRRDWKKQIEFSIDPEKAKKYRDRNKPKQKDVCTMCGEYCAMKQMEEHVR